MPSRLPKRRKPTPREAGEPADAAKRDDAEIRASDLTGLKFFKKIRPLLDSLHDIGTARDKSGNRDLQMDQYSVLVPLKQIAATLATEVPSADPSKFDATVQFGVGHLFPFAVKAISCRLRLDRGRQRRRQAGSLVPAAHHHRRVTRPHERPSIH